MGLLIVFAIIVLILKLIYEGDKMKPVNDRIKQSKKEMDAHVQKILKDR